MRSQVFFSVKLDQDRVGERWAHIFLVIFLCCYLLGAVYLHRYFVVNAFVCISCVDSFVLALFGR